MFGNTIEKLKDERDALTAALQKAAAQISAALYAVACIALMILLALAAR